MPLRMYIRDAVINSIIAFPHDDFTSGDLVNDVSARVGKAIHQHSIGAYLRNLASRGFIGRAEVSNSDRDSARPYFKTQDLSKIDWNIRDGKL